MAGEKTEKATPKRKQDERKKGNIFQSQEVVTVFSLLIVFYSFKFLAPYIMGTLEKCVTDFFTVAAVVDEVSMQGLMGSPEYQAPRCFCPSQPCRCW